MMKEASPNKPTGQVTLKLFKEGEKSYLRVYFDGRKVEEIRVCERGSEVDVVKTAEKVSRVLGSRALRFVDGVGIEVKASPSQVLEVVEKAIRDGVARIHVPVKKRKTSPEEDMLARELWKKGLQFLRCVNVYGYSVDFLLPRYRVILEVDGLVHFREEVSEKDLDKLRRLEDKGYRVYRIDARDVRRSPESVAEFVKQACLRTLKDKR